MLTEQWKPIKDFEGCYEASNLGEVRSLDKTIKDIMGRRRPFKGQILKTALSAGYLCLQLSKDRIAKTYFIHRLVWDTFGDRPRNGHKLQVDHKDGNKLNNKFDNLQLLTPRENASKGHKERGKDLPAGVCWDKKRQKYLAQIQIDGKHLFLGAFNCPTTASFAYQKKLECL